MPCAPSQFCGCCECRGKRCLIWHPGHSHAVFGVDPDPILTALVSAVAWRERAKRTDGHLGAVED